MLDETNELAVLAIHSQHWFYINHALVGYARLARLPQARLDVAIVAGCGQHVICHFQHFRVLVPEGNNS